ncbi:ATP-binding protein [Antarcticirhabdus aurantiaca]|uniref:ATP-binding protein n=1 Tax=Antarcticirhabdus aurantiaca TaxID=2606717 RepID=UPI00131AFE59|nr:ATP-binding protein [Antarcticirhabdus aurantiaca]
MSVGAPPAPLDDWLEEAFEERADHVEEDVLRDGTATGDHFDDVVRKLHSKGLVLLVGPRGCGKTHLMRYAWLECLDDETKPFCIYTSLNKYLSLEPWSAARTDARALFHSWVLARILQAGHETLERVSGVASGGGARLQAFINNLERRFDLEDEDEDLHRRLSVESVKATLVKLAERAGRKRIVLLLDDAALTLAPAFMSEFLDILRVVKSAQIAPKCSIYPGTTVFGPRFHADHEGRTVSAWVPVTEPGYAQMMQTIAARRYPSGLATVPSDANTLLQYAAFGIPRAYLSLIREYNSVVGNAGRRSGTAASQAKLIQIVRDLRDNRVAEFLSLAEKIVELKTLVTVGERFFNGVVEAIRDHNEGLVEKGQKQVAIGIDASEFDSLTTRMVDLLSEAGLLSREQEVSHGPDRRYRRFIPHFAALIAARTFSAGSRGTSAAAIVKFIERPDSKHPVRRTFETVLKQQKVRGPLKLDLPACQACGAPRQNEKQRFCQHCGNRLTDELIYNRIMAMGMPSVPGLTPFLSEKLQGSGIRTIGELLASRDPGSDLRKILDIGPARSMRIIQRVESYIDEAMS